MFIKVQKPTPSTCKGLMFIQPSLKINKPTRIDLLITFQALKFRGIACSKELPQKVTTKYLRNTLIRKLSSPNGGVFLSLRKTSPRQFRRHNFGRGSRFQTFHSILFSSLPPILPFSHLLQPESAKLRLFKRSSIHTFSLAFIHEL